MIGIAIDDDFEGILFAQRCNRLQELVGHKSISLIIDDQSLDRTGVGSHEFGERPKQSSGLGFGGLLQDLNELLIGGKNSISFRKSRTGRECSRGALMIIRAKPPVDFEIGFVSSKISVEHSLSTEKRNILSDVGGTARNESFGIYLDHRNRCFRR